MRKRLLYLIPCFLLWLGIFGASFSLKAYAAGLVYQTPISFHHPSWGDCVLYSCSSSNDISSSFDNAFALDSSGVLYFKNYGYMVCYSSTLNSIVTYSPSTIGTSGIFSPSLLSSFEAFSNRNAAVDALYAYVIKPPSIYDDSLILNPKWAYMSGNGLLILNPSANVASTEITLNNLTTGNSFDYSTGSGQVYINFNQSIASVGDRIQFVMVPKDSDGNFGDTYYLSQTIDLINFTTIDTVVSRPYVPVSIPSSSGSGDTVINVPVSGTTSYTVYNNNPVTNVSSNPVTNYVISVDYSNTEYNQETIEIINQYIVNNYDNTSNQVVNNYVYYETNNNIDIDINITSIKQTFNDIKSLGFNLLNFFTNIRIIFTDVFGFLPAWLIALIFAGFVLIIVFVIAKLILLIL